MITKDSHQQVVSEAIGCTQMLAKGLRKQYRGTAASLCSGALVWWGRRWSLWLGALV